jgi:hypothetical protein
MIFTLFATFFMQHWGLHLRAVMRLRSKLRRGELVQALDWMNEYLKGERSSLPPSQIVRTVPRGMKPYTGEDTDSDLLPDIQESPDPGDEITYDGSVLKIPK